MPAPIPSSRPLPRRALRICLAGAALLVLAGCDLKDIPGLGPDPRLLQKQAEAKAVGGACRHALRGLEDCYTLNPAANKADVFAGWKDMDLYMRENKIEGTPSVLTQLEKPIKPAKAKRAHDADEAGEDSRDSRNRS